MKDQLSKYKIVRCDMIHEKVLSSDSSGTGEELCLIRRDLCPAKERSFRLGCAHAASNSRYVTLLEQMRENMLVQTYREEFEKLILEIYQLDHQMGNLEKELFLQSEELKQPIQNQIEEVVREHRALMDELERVHLQVLQEVSKGD